MRLHLTLVAALLVPAVLTAQRDRDDRKDKDKRDRTCEYGECDGDDRRSRIDTTFAFDRRGQVELTAVAGDMTVRGWDRGEARVVATSDRARLRLDASRSRITLREEDGRGRSSDGTEYELTVPYGTRVVMRNTSGDLEVVDVRGEVEARSTSGDVKIEGTSGRTIVESISGEVEARRLSGPVRVQSTSGGVRLDEVSGDVEAESVSGDVELKHARAAFVRLESTSGEIDFAGPLDRSGRYEFTSHSGTITLTVPGDVDAQMSVQTFSGELESDFPLTLRPGSGSRPRRFDFTLGSGGARITAESFSGDVNLRRGSASSPSRD